MGGDVVDASNLCWTFAQTGRCKRGDLCTWSHARLAPTGSDPADTTCRAWLLWGSCPRGDQCTWHHPPVCMHSAPTPLGISRRGSEDTSCGEFATQPPPPPPPAPPGNFSMPDGEFQKNGEPDYSKYSQLAYSTHQQLAAESGATPGQQLLSMIGATCGAVEGAAKNHDEQQDRPLQPWQPDVTHPCVESDVSTASSPTELNVVLEDMLDAQAAWDQFDVNESRFGVKTSFDDSLSQYTTVLQVANVPSEIRHKADSIACEIEHEHKANLHLDDDGYRCTAAENDNDEDEEAKFSSVSRHLVEIQYQ